MPIDGRVQSWAPDQGANSLDHNLIVAVCPHGVESMGPWDWDQVILILPPVPLILYLEEISEFVVDIFVLSYSVHPF